MQGLVDLTYLISKGGSRYPTDPDPRIVIIPAEVSNEGKVKSGYTELTIRTHHRTHIDAPAHKIPSGKTIHQYDLSKFINPAFLIDLMPYLDDAEFVYIRIISEDILRRVFTSELLRQMQENISALIFRTGYDKVIERGGQATSIFPISKKGLPSFWSRCWNKTV